MLVSGFAGHGRWCAAGSPAAAHAGPAVPRPIFAGRCALFPAPARIRSSAAIRFLLKSSGMCPFRRATPATASGGTGCTYGQIQAFRIRAERPYGPPPVPPQRSTVRAERSLRSVVQGAASVPLRVANQRRLQRRPAPDTVKARTQQAGKMLCRRGEYSLFSPRVGAPAGLQQDFAAVRLARRLAAPFRVFTRMVSVLVIRGK